MNAPIKQLNMLLIAGLTPHFLEKPVLWWAQNETEIIEKRALTPLWRDNTAVIESGVVLKQSEFLRTLADLGYEKVSGALFPGTFKHLGSTILIHPINHAHPYAIDFLGSVIKSIEERADVERASISYEAGPRKLHEFKSGDYVVHIDHGIGIFRGIIMHEVEPRAHVKESSFQGESLGTRKGLPLEDSLLVTPYFKIEYAPAREGGEPDTLLVPVSEKKRIEAYLGLERPRIHRLGTQLWSNTKRKAKEDIIAFAKSLIRLYRTRTAVTRPPSRGCSPLRRDESPPYGADPLEKEIGDGFEHELTPSQSRSLEEIFADLSKPQPMERLLAGDVGFGKTEIALRAALRVAMNGKQVAILAPTTVLADQHFQTFSERLKRTPLSVAVATRLQSDSANRKTFAGVGAGTVDIVIGTHRMFSRDVAFKNLGLLIIDEEQRFGVRHKEHFKEKYPAIDILTLSATPIPRTLAFSLAGVRPFSQIEEAPRGRKAPLTSVFPFSKKLVREALAHELKRGGQTYYLASRIHTIPKTLELLKTLAPKAKCAAIHGRMPEKDILAAMRHFRRRDIDILVSTTIIENGLDISSANTLIAEDATRLGLAQAHQLRGRVGRGEHQAFAYFLYPPHHLTEDAEKRLEYLMEFSELGSGLEIAKRDLELRGAGNILGRDQSGVANRIGWNLYFQFVNEAIGEMEGLSDA
ncbi:MAG: DEAD/DEAH box helicase [Candidatus Niyogibacteria bacterium]|nr:DEAD/DEAH box helicase [Candidatus Niyogibacteria bacterium]